MEDDVKEIHLQRSESLGFGFSIIGGLGSELPPVICDIVEDSPADHCDQLHAGDAIIAVNGVQVSTFTTKEVLRTLRLSGPQLHLKLSQDPLVRARAERYLSCSPEDISVLRDVISQQDLTGVDELIVKCGASGSPRSSPKRARPSPQHAGGGQPSASPTMPNRRDEDLGRGSMRTHGHSHIPRMRNDPHAHTFSKAYHENGVDPSTTTSSTTSSTTTTAHNGKNARTQSRDPPDNSAQTKQKERGFETFVMTGDMIIRTTKKSEPARKVASEKIPKREPLAKTPTDSPKTKMKGSPAKSQGSPSKTQQSSPSRSAQGSPSKSSQGSPVKTQGSPSKIPGSPLKSKKPESRIPTSAAESRIPVTGESRIPVSSSKSRIPKPPQKGTSPKHTARESPKPTRAPLSFPRNERTVAATMASPEPMDIENLEAVNNNVMIIPTTGAKSEETVDARKSPPLHESVTEIELDEQESMEVLLSQVSHMVAETTSHRTPESLALHAPQLVANYPVSPPEPMFSLELSPEEGQEPPLSLGGQISKDYKEEAREHLVYEEPIHAFTQPSSLESSMTAGAMTSHSSFPGEMSRSYPAEMSQSAPVSSLGYMSFAGYRFPDVDMALDIPPDDISSEDDNYRNLQDSLVDVDDLPPPPDELLQDFTAEKQETQPLTPYPACAILLSDNYTAAVAGEATQQYQQASSDPQVHNGGGGPGIGPHKHSYEPTTLDTVVEAEVIITTNSQRGASSAIPVPGSQNRNVSKSAEKTTRGPGVRYTDPSAGVRTSRSQENYFQNTGDGISLVDIDFDESMASSVDALPYSEKSSTSLDTVSMPGHVPLHDHHSHETSRSLDNSPERNYDKYVERVHMPTFISVDEPQGGVPKTQPKHQQHLHQNQPPQEHELTNSPKEDHESSFDDTSYDGVFSQEEIAAAGDNNAVKDNSRCSTDIPRGSPSRLVKNDTSVRSPLHRLSSPVPSGTDDGASLCGAGDPAGRVLTVTGVTLTSSADSVEGEMGPNVCKSGSSPSHSPISRSKEGVGSRGVKAKKHHSPLVVADGGGAAGAAAAEGEELLTDSASEHNPTLSCSPQPQDHEEEAVEGAGGGEGPYHPSHPHVDIDQLDMVEVTSGPPSPDGGGGGGESDTDSVYHQPIKDVDRPSASRLAKRLFLNDGFKKQDISRHLHKKNDFAQLVGEEYLKFFDFTSDTLEQALRKFLKHLTLAGETQERERVLAHFSKRFMECNPQSFKSEDACHTLTCALMLLNTDLHGQNIGRKMTLNEFIDNLSELNDGNNFPIDTLKQLYTAIKTEPLECEIEQDVEDLEALAASGRAQAVPPPEQRFIGHNPFLDVPDASKATEYKKGYVMRKCCLDADGRRTPIGKRGWKMFYATLRDMVLYLHKDEHAMKKSGNYDNMSNAIRIHHSLATKASDYTKKQHVIRLHTADGAQYLFQTSDIKECQEWIDTINFVAASFSAPPLPGGVGSQKKFQRPLMPSSYTKLNLREQLQHHEQQVQQREHDLHEHQLYPPEKGAKSRIIQDYVEKERFLQYEMKRFKTYLFLLQAKVASFPELEPSLVEVAIGEVEEPLPSPESSHTSRVAKAQQPPASTTTTEQESRSKPVQRSMSDRDGSQPLFHFTHEWPPETLMDPYLYARETCV